MKILPKRNLMLGRVAQQTETDGGIIMPNAQQNQSTVFVVIDRVGPDVKGQKPGDVIIPHHFNWINLRGGGKNRCVLVKEEDVQCSVEDVSMANLKIENATARIDIDF